MIRPVTLICWILALSAGLYLYRAKHEVELIDQHIDQIAKQTADLRVESRALLDEWIRLGEPEQLHKYSDEYLGLQPISPGQFARLSDLPARLPAPQADPPEEQANVVAQSSGSTSLGVSSPDDRSSGNQAGVVPVEPASADSEAAASADDIPVPPIPPAKSPVSATAASGATTLPLQARPVTPRPADGQIEPETTRTRVAASPQGVDDSHAGVTRLVTSATAAEPHQAPQGPVSGQAPGQPGGQPHGLPPLQAQGPRDTPGLPPPQTQGPTHEVVQGPARGPAQGQSPGRAAGQGPSQPALRPMESRTADNRLNEPPREIRPIEAQPLQRQASEPRGPGAEFGRQGLAQTEQAQTGQAPMAPAQGGSLLGMSRGSAPLPLPAPVPVNANWSGPPGSGR